MRAEDIEMVQMTGPSGPRRNNKIPNGEENDRKEKRGKEKARFRETNLKIHRPEHISTFNSTGSCRRSTKEDCHPDADNSRCIYGFAQAGEEMVLAWCRCCSFNLDNLGILA